MGRSAFVIGELAIHLMLAGRPAPRIVACGGHDPGLMQNQPDDIPLRAGAAAAEAPHRPGFGEQQLVEAHRGGDPDAIGRLLRLYQRRVHSICHRMVGEQEARDLTQDALLRILEGLDTYDGRSKLSTWVIRVTMNCCLSHLRWQKLRRHASLDAPAAAPENAWNQEPAPLRRVEQAEARSAVLRALGGLDPDMRAVLVLRDLQDLDYHRLAEVLDVPVGTVKSRLFRARAALRQATEAELGRGSPG